MDFEFGSRKRKRKRERKSKRGKGLLGGISLGGGGGGGSIITESRPKPEKKIYEEEGIVSRVGNFFRNLPDSEAPDSTEFAAEAGSKIPASVLKAGLVGTLGYQGYHALVNNPVAEAIVEYGPVVAEEAGEVYDTVRGVGRGAHTFFSAGGYIPDKYAYGIEAVADTLAGGPVRNTLLTGINMAATGLSIGSVVLPLAYNGVKKVGEFIFSGGSDEAPESNTNYLK
jgi:hypothetical protein